jgi:L-seryl-tRNA(Ser) seleniumtransferase
MPEPVNRPPAIESLLSSDGARALMSRFGRARVLAALRASAERMRSGALSSADELIADAARSLARPPAGPRPVLNATGVLLHTNLGRAPLAARAKEAAWAAAGACAVEIDLTTGARGKRGELVRPLLLEVFAPGRSSLDALAVTNNAAALLLALDTAANGKRVAVSRGELVAIGGDFRVPSILAKSGATLMEVGTTNKTALRDYEEALAEGAGALLKVHPSNYRIVGHTGEVDLAELGALATRAGVPLIYDAGSAAPEREEVFGGFPRPLEALDAGAHLVCFSGDKALGGPQAGVLLGDARLVAACAQNPLARALRPDKLVLAALAATLELHRDRALEEIPLFRMLHASLASLSARADALAVLARAAGFEAAVAETEATTGGGTGADTSLPSHAVRLAEAGRSAPDLAAALRALPLPVLARVADDAVLLDLRSVEPEDDDALGAAIEALGSIPR